MVRLDKARNGSYEYGKVQGLVRLGLVVLCLIDKIWLS